ncbi:MAG: prepilin-type N-terminal cleavage/methylation domain-containing protein [Azospirillaceae bacterium]
MTDTLPARLADARASARRRSARDREAGFSLVELAIVLIIIGLIVGGVLKGQDLIESARVNSIQTQLNEVRVAASTFLNKYDDLPGDLANEDLVDAGDTDLAGGDGNGRVEGVRTGDAQGDSEAVAFWQQLRADSLLGGIQNIAGNDMAAADGLQSRVGGYYTILWDTQGGTTSHWILLGAGVNTNDNDDSVLTPLQIRGIDVKSDDGDPTAGNVLAEDGADAPNAGDCVSSGDYATGDAVACVALFKL